MAFIRPFRGLRYNLKKIDSLEKVVTPPYDIISPEQQEAFYQKSPYNMVRLDFGKVYDTDNQIDNRYTRASRSFEDWQKRAILRRDKRPTIYLYHVTYTLHGNRVFTRKGFLSLVKLEDFSSGMIKPHEKTFPKVTRDRLKLMEHCGANFSPVFSLYSDQENKVMKILERHKPAEPLISFYDWAGLKHEVWAVTDQKAIASVQKNLDGKTLFIADGHHRYTTALEYCRIMQTRYPEYDQTHAFNYIMMYLCAMEDEGLVILPTHRLVGVNTLLWEEFLDKAVGYFDIERLILKKRDYAGQAEEALCALEKAGLNRRTIGLYTGSDNALYMLGLKRGTGLKSSDAGIAEPLQELDVVILTELVLDRFMGLGNKNNHLGEKVHYYHNAREAMEQAAKNRNMWAFLLNPTRIEQVRNVAMAGLVMPHKSTYFYPKILTGLVINKIMAEEEV